MVYPLFNLLKRSFQDKTGEFVGLANYITYFSSARTSASLWHSFNIAAISMVVTVVLAFGYAYALARVTIPGKKVFRVVALLPMFIPSVVQALAFIYMFGNNGIFTRISGINIGLYGPVGIVMSEVFWAFPHAITVLSTALMLTDARLYEAAESLDASGPRTFFTVTLPGVKYGLMSAAFVVFTLAITDFGAPKVVGGDYGVLATDIYAWVFGQQNFVMGATISALLLVPTAVSFVLDRLVQRRQVAQVTAEIVPLKPKQHNPLVQRGLFVLCALVAVFILSVYGMVFVGAFTKYWPYDLSLTFKNFTEFYVAGAHHSALHLLWNTVKIAALTAVGGTIIVFFSAYLIERSRKYTVPFLTATAALKQMDPAFEAIGESLDAPFYRTFWRVVAPLGLPAIISIATYLFLNSPVTLSAIAFLFCPGQGNGVGDGDVSGRCSRNRTGYGDGVADPRHRADVARLFQPTDSRH